MTYKQSHHLYKRDGSLEVLVEQPKLASHRERLITLALHDVPELDDHLADVEHNRMSHNNTYKQQCV